MKKLIIPALALLFSVCQAQAQTKATTHPAKQEKKTVVTHPKKKGQASTSVTVRKTTPARKTTSMAKGKTRTQVHQNAVASGTTRMSKTTSHQAYGPKVPTTAGNRADTTKPKHTYAKAHMRHTSPAKKTKTKAVKKTK